MQPQTPRITLVTACLNQRDTLEQTLRSVLEQLTPDDEYIVLDGGSRDGSHELLTSYATRLTRLICQPDRGQADALNRGFSLASGDVLGWINGDDRLCRGALQAVRAHFQNCASDVLCGACRYEFDDGRPPQIRRVSPADLARLPIYDGIHQPSCFFRRSAFARCGPLDAALHFGMDWDFWLRLRRAGCRFALTRQVLSVYRVTGVNKTSVGGERRNRELYQLLLRHAPQHRLRNELAYRVLWPLKRLRAREPRWLYRSLSDAARTASWMALGPLLGFDAVRTCTHPYS